MGMLTRYFYPWGLILQVVAIVHFIRRRPDTYWLYIILFLGPIGALVYIFAEMVPDVGLLNQSFKGTRKPHWGGPGSRRVSGPTPIAARST